MHFPSARPEGQRQQKQPKEVPLPLTIIHFCIVNFFPFPGRIFILRSASTPSFLGQGIAVYPIKQQSCIACCITLSGLLLIVHYITPHFVVSVVLTLDLFIQCHKAVSPILGWYWAMNLNGANQINL